MSKFGTGYFLIRSSIVILVLMLWIQWPLRIFLIGNSRTFNDIGQIAFAFFVVVAFADACRLQSHLIIQLSVDGQQSTPVRYGLIKHVFLLSWALFIAYSAMPVFVNSLFENEKFPDTYTGGFYFIKLALLVFPLSLIFHIGKIIIKELRDKW